MATGGMDTSSVEIMPMSEYARAQKGSASGSLQAQLTRKTGASRHDSGQIKCCKAKNDVLSGMLTYEVRTQGTVAGCAGKSGRDSLASQGGSAEAVR